jgi:hypothetical protein
MQAFRRTYPFLQGVTPQTLQPGQHLSVALLGDSRSGKSTFVSRCTTGQFHAEYQPTLGILTTAATFTVASRGTVLPVKVFLNEFGGAYTAPSTDRVHLDEVGLATLRVCRVALVFFDGTLAGKESIEAMEARVRKWLALCDGLGIPTILVASHQDEPVSVHDRGGRECQQPSVQLITRLLWHALPGEPVRCGFCVSSRSNYNLDKPVSWALARHYGDEELYLVESTPAPLLLLPRQSRL